MNINPSRIARPISLPFVYQQINHFIEARKFYLDLYLKLHSKQFLDVPFEHLWDKYSDQIDMVLHQHNCFQQANQSFKPIMSMLLETQGITIVDEHSWWSLFIFIFIFIFISMPIDCTSSMIDLTLQFRKDYYFGTGLLSEHLNDNSNDNAFRMKFKIYPSQNGYFNSQEQTTIFQINNQLVQTMKSTYPFVCGERLYEWLSETNTQSIESETEFDFILWEGEYSHYIPYFDSEHLCFGNLDS